jgi:hypothetical protein
MQDQEQNTKEVSEYFFNDPEKGEQALERAEREKETRPQKDYDTEIVRTSGKKEKG